VTDRAVIRRRRAVALGLLVLAGLAVFVFVPVPGLACDASPAKTCAPRDDAIDLVPAGADAYLHIDLDPGSGQYKTAKEVSARLPHSATVEQGLFAALGLGRGLNLKRDVAPWIGNEAALAELGPGRPAPLLLLAVKDRKRAKAFLARLGNGLPRPISHGKGQLHLYGNGLGYAELGNFIALGNARAVGAAIHTKGGGASLADDDRAKAVRGGLPDQRVADLYLSVRGLRTLVDRGTAFASQLDTFTNFAATQGIAAALVAHGGGFELQLDSALGPVKAKTHPGFFQAFPGFHPSLAGEFSPDTLLYLEIANPADTVRALLRQAAASAPGLVASAKRFEGDVRSRGVDIEKDLLPALGDEAAAGFAAGPSGPYLTLVFKNVDEQRARSRMAQLQAPLAAALSPARTGQAPSFGSEKLGNTVINSVRLSPNLDIAYAIFDNKLVISTNPAGVRQAVEGGENLSGSGPFKAATGGASGGTSALVFLSLEGLVKRAVPLGLGQALGGFSADIAKLKALGLSVKSTEDSLKTTIFLNIE
jgi:uncharacterized protein DUF3352